MRAENAAGIAMLLIVLTPFGRVAIASSGNGIVHLDWEPRTEILEYHSCGAADACWVAQVKDKKTKRRIAELRCDGEQLFARVGKHPETVAEANCRNFENENKFREIPSALRALLNR